jgi:hypothetical protein
VPGYTEVRPLGGGGFGEVVLATHDASGTAVAVKYLHPDLLGDPEHVAMFRAEARTLIGLDSPHVVRLYEYVEGPAGAAIVMELIEGITLAALLDREGETTPEAALVVLYGSLLGLAAAHARGVVHRDYKPANVLVNGQGASKLTDFGIAALAGSRPVPTGTLRYMPPEQFEGAPASPAADVYAATVTFYQCLVGRVPFDGRTSTELYEQHRSAQVPMEEVPGPLQAVIARGLAKDPRYRPSDAVRLAAELRQVATAGYGPDWEDRGRSHLAEVALLLLALLWPSGGSAAVAGSTVEQVQLNDPTRGPRQPHPSHPAQPGHEAQAAHTAQAGHATGSGQAGQTQAEHLEHVEHLEHAEHLVHVEHEEHLAHLRHLGREDGGPSGEQSTGRRILRRARSHPVVVAVIAAAVVVIAVVAAFASSGGGGTPRPGGLPGAGGSAALAGASPTGAGGGAPATAAGLPNYCGGWSTEQIEGTVAPPVTAASVASDLQQEIATCTGHSVTVTCVPYDIGATYADYQCSIPAQETSGTYLQAENEIFASPATGNWTYAGVP